MSERTLVVGLELTTDAPDEVLTDSALWSKAVGVFKEKITVSAVVIGGTGKGEAVEDAPTKPARKKSSLKRKATAKKKATRRKAKD